MGKKKKYITKDEVELLSKLSPKFATGSEESKKLYDLNNPYFVVDERENNLEISWETGNEQGYLSMVLLTLYSWDAGKQPLISKTQRIYMVPKDKAHEPKTYLSNNMVRYEINIEDVVSVCINRFGSAINKKAIGDTIASIASRDTPLSFDPYRALVKLYMQQIKADETKRVEFEEFKSKFTQLGDEAPYTDFVLKLLLIQPWSVAEHKQTPQHMPIFKSEQGVGKSTIINRLGLSWADEIKTLVGKNNSEKLEIANKRELNAVLEFAEMSRFTTTSIEENKSAVTVREEQMLLKFSNLLTKFTYRALIVGSTNSEAFLKDNTGERRYLPLEIESFSRDLTYDFVGRAIATAIVDNDKRVANGEDEDKVWNIYHEETDEDLDFKRANFGLEDTAVLGVQKWLKQKIESRILNGVAYIGFWFDKNGDMPVPTTLEDNPVVAVDLENKKLVIQGLKKTKELWLNQTYDILGVSKDPSVFPILNFNNYYRVTRKRYLVGDLRTWFLEVPFKALPDVTNKQWQDLANIASLDVIRNTKPVFNKAVDPDLPF